MSIFCVNVDVYDWFILTLILKDTYVHIESMQKISRCFVIMQLECVEEPFTKLIWYYEVMLENKKNLAMIHQQIGGNAFLYDYSGIANHFCDSLQICLLFVLYNMITLEE